MSTKSCIFTSNKVGFDDSRSYPFGEGGIGGGALYLSLSDWTSRDDSFIKNSYLPDNGSNKYRENKDSGGGAVYIKGGETVDILRGTFSYNGHSDTFKGAGCRYFTSPSVLYPGAGGAVWASDVDVFRSRISTFLNK